MHRLNYVLNDIMKSTHVLVYQVSNHQIRSTDHRMLRLDFEFDSLCWTMNRIQTKACYRLLLKVKWEKEREKKTITILFPISHIHEYFEIENLHSIPLISESSVTEPFSGGCALAGDLFWKRNTESFFRNCILWILWSNVHCKMRSIFVLNTSTAWKVLNWKCFNFLCCAWISTPIAFETQVTKTQPLNIDNTHVKYAKLWNQQASKQFSIRNIHTQTHPLINEKCAKEGESETDLPKDTKRQGGKAEKKTEKRKYIYIQ